MSSAVSYPIVPDAQEISFVIRVQEVHQVFFVAVCPEHNHSNSTLNDRNHKKKGPSEDTPAPPPPHRYSEIQHLWVAPLKERALESLEGLQLTLGAVRCVWSSETMGTLFLLGSPSSGAVS